MAGGQEITGEQGSFGNSGTIRLRSRKTGVGTASAALTGSAVSMSQGAFGLQSTKAQTGSAITSSAGTMTTTPTWSATVPTITFPQGTAATYNLLQYTTNFNSTLHEVALEASSAALPTGVTLPATGLLTYNGTSPVSSVSGVIFEIKDKVAALTPESDFAARSAGAIRTFNFDTASQLGGGFGSNFGVIPGVNGVPVIDTAVKASGSGSMRFNLLAGQGSNANWFSNFSSDLSKLYGGNTSFFIQWKMRLSQAVYEDWAHKYILIGTGDEGSLWFNSCTALELEMEHYSNANGISGAINQFPIMYNGCPGSCGASSVFAFQEPFNGSDFKLQNGISSPFCRYQDATKSGCIHVVPDSWMVFQIGVNLGPRISSGGHFWYSNSRVRAWMQQSPTSPETLFIDWTAGTTPGSAIGLCGGSSGNERYGKVWLLPYTQNNVANPRAGSVWYDELIISESKIPAAQA